MDLRLEEKGWTKKEISHLHRKLRKVEKDRHPGYRLIEAALFWIVLLFAILISLSLSFVLLLMFVFLKPSFVYILAALVGVMFGMLFEISLRHIDWIEHKHHAIGGFVILAAVLLNLMVFSSSFIERIPLFRLVTLPPNAQLFLGISYTAAFFIPFFAHKVTTKRFY